MQQSEFRSTMDASRNNVNISSLPKLEAANQEQNLRHHPPPSHDSAVVNVNLDCKRPRRRREVAPKEVVPPVPDNENLNDQVNEEDRVFFESLPPGYRFCPTDDELIDHYLFKKLKNVPLPRNQIREVNIYRFNPDDIAARYPSINKNAWYFFTPRDKKYLHGSRPNRAAGAGFWKACGADRVIHDKVDASIKIGLKKALVYHRGRPPKGHKTNWLMHEFMLHKEHPHLDEIVPNTPENSWKLNEFVLCKIYKRNDNSIKAEEAEAKEEEEVKEVEVKEEVDAKLNANVKVEEAGHGELQNFAPPLPGGLHYSYPTYNPSVQNPYFSYHLSHYKEGQLDNPSVQNPYFASHQSHYKEGPSDNPSVQNPYFSYHQSHYKEGQFPPTSYHQNQPYDQASNVNSQALMTPSLPGYDSSSNNFGQVSSDSLPGYDSSSMNFEQISAKLEEMDYFVMSDEFDIANNAPSFANELASKLLNDLPSKVA